MIDSINAWHLEKKIICLSGEYLVMPAVCKQQRDISARASV